MYGSLGQIESPTGGRKLPPRGASKKRVTMKKGTSKKKLEEPVFQKIFKKSPPPSFYETASERTQHSFLYTLLNPRSRQWQAQFFKTFMSFVICLDLGFFVFSTEPRFKGSQIFRDEEAIVSSIFLFEYVARLVTCIESRHYAPLGPIKGRFRYAITTNAIIDAAATFPYFFEKFTGINMPTLTYLRVFRLLRILKTEQYSNAMDAVYRVLYYNSEILYVALLICILLVLFTGVLMYYLRPPKDPDGNFHSILATTYIATLMLTGQGGPDQADLPWYTRCVILLTGFFSVAMFAIPASMLTWGFEAEAERLAASSRRKRLARRSGTLNESSSSGSEWTSSDEDSSDEEYQKIIAGEEEEEDEEEKIKRLMAVFNKADTDKTGTLDRDEFVKQLMEADALGTGPKQSGPDMGRSRHAAARPPPSTTARISKLEAKVEDMSVKLDTLIEILSSSK